METQKIKDWTFKQLGVYVGWACVWAIAYFLIARFCYHHIISGQQISSLGNFIWYSISVVGFFWSTWGVIKKIVQAVSKVVAYTCVKTYWHSKTWISTNWSKYTQSRLMQEKMSN